MDLKKTIAGISALAMLAGMSAYAPVSAFAANEEKDYTTGAIEAYLYSPEEKIDVVCRFYEDMPNVPYISLSEYYQNWSGDVLSIEGSDGKYTITTPLGADAEIDTANDTFSALSYEAVTYPASEISEDSSITKLFIIEDEADIAGEYCEFTIDFSNYDIDLHGDENDIWFPAPTLCNLFRGSIYTAEYLNNKLYFMDEYGEFNMNAVFTPDAAAELAASMANGRPEDLAAYNYNELCRIFDCEYGYPGRIPLNDVMAENGMNGLLSETNDDTRLVKSHLLSTDFTTYLLGLLETERYFWDGGHTVLEIGLLMLPELLPNVLEQYAPNSYELSADAEEDGALSQYALEAFYAARSQVTGDDEEGIYRYIENGDTALFSFDSFIECDIYGWNAYYCGEGDRPDDIISAFYDCVKMADENPDIKNFVVDISTNGGGLLMVNQYMMALMADQDTYVMDLLKYGATISQKYITDKNLDGKFDEEDENLKFDLNFGIIESKQSFSCANLMASDARDAGLLVLGQRSGGGSCTVLNFVTPDGMPVYISSKTRLSNQNGENIDAGIVPDYELVKFNEDGSLDASAAFDFDILSLCFEKFYSDKKCGLGDFNGDKMIDANDASNVLNAYAAASTGDIVILSEAEKYAADVNKDNKIDSVDASAILAYYSYISTDGTDDFETFLSNQAK